VAAALGFFSPLALGAFFALGVFAGVATTGAASSAILELGCCSFGFGNQTDKECLNTLIFYTIQGVSDPWYQHVGSDSNNCFEFLTINIAAKNGIS
jgi:hypothetical protein